jgi:hypothetical protein
MAACGWRTHRSSGEPCANRRGSSARPFPPAAPAAPAEMPGVRGFAIAHADAMYAPPETAVT